MASLHSTRTVTLCGPHLFIQRIASCAFVVSLLIALPVHAQTDPFDTFLDVLFNEKSDEAKKNVMTDPEQIKDWLEGKDGREMNWSLPEDLPIPNNVMTTCPEHCGQYVKRINEQISELYGLAKLASDSSEMEKRLKQGNSSEKVIEQLENTQALRNNIILTRDRISQYQAELAKCEQKHECRPTAAPESIIPEISGLSIGTTPVQCGACVDSAADSDKALLAHTLQQSEYASLKAWEAFYESEVKVRNDALDKIIADHDNPDYKGEEGAKKWNEKRKDANKKLKEASKLQKENTDRLKEVEKAKEGLKKADAHLKSCEKSRCGDNKSSGYSIDDKTSQATSWNQLFGWGLDIGVNGSSTDIVDQAGRDSMMMSSLPLISYEHDDVGYGFFATGRYEFATFTDRVPDADKEINTVTRQTAVQPYAEFRFDYYDGPEAEEKFSGPDGGTASFRRAFMEYGIGLGGGLLIKPSVTSRWAIDLGAGISAMKSEIKLDASYDLNGHELDSFSDKSSHTYASPYGQLGFSYQMNSRLRLGAGVDVRRIEAKDPRLGKEYSDTPVGGYLKISIGLDK